MIKVKDIPFWTSILLMLVYCVKSGFSIDLDYAGALHSFSLCALSFRYFINTESDLHIKSMAIVITWMFLFFLTFNYLFNIELDWYFNVILFIIFITFTIIYKKNADA